MLFGIDVSSFQSTINMGQVAREGFDFCLVKATQGATYVNPAYHAQFTGAQATGMLVCAYHFATTDPVSAQVANVTRTVAPGAPVIVDAEAGSGTIGNIRALVVGLQAAGHPVPLLYLPSWYWGQIGSPSLVGLPPLWSSKYPTTSPGFASALYANVPASYWNSYGGLSVGMLQFADSARVAGLQVDASAYQGSRDELAALLGGGAPTPTPAPPMVSEEAVSHIVLPPTPTPKNKQDDPATWPTQEVTIPIAQIGGWHGDAMVQVTLSPYYDHDPKVCGYVRYANWFVTPDIKVTEPFPVGVDDVINQAGAAWHVMWPAKWGPAPQDTVSFSISYAAPNGGVVEVERQH